MEMINRDKLRCKKPKAVIFDFDGTISTLRQGWEQVMLSMMIEMMDPSGENKSINKEVGQYIRESAGIQTIYQMQWLVRKISENGIDRQIHDEWWYKEEYNKRLMGKISSRLSDLFTGKSSPSDFMVKGSEIFLQKLAANNISLYVASGTDNGDVVNEVRALGLYSYFKSVAGAPYRKAECSKEAVINDLINEKKLNGENLLVIGDGKVEIALGKKAGALTLGVASDEIKRYGVNGIKRENLIKAGADVIIGDFSDIGRLSEWLGLE